MAYFVALLLFSVASAKAKLFDPQLDERWENFKEVFEKQYTDGEELVRRLIWEKRMVDIMRHNLQADMGQHNFRKGINKFSDLRHEEFVKQYNGYKRAGHRYGSSWLEPLNIEVPKAIDWRDWGYVTPIKDQGDCGSCWAFSATGSLEGQQKKKSGILTPLSEQNLVDCLDEVGNMACYGGDTHLAFEYVKNNKGINTEESYPYFGEEESCVFQRENVGATCSGYIDIPSGKENVLKTSVATIGPISVAIDASQESFQSYKSGIYDEPNCGKGLSDLDHAVLVVGYGTENGKDYWLVKNSWGKSWGESGYIKMSRNKGNQCGIATDACYPLV